MERQQLDKSREAEIDLSHLFTSITNSIGRFFRLVRTNLLAFLGVFVLAGGLVHTAQYLIPRSYATKGVFVSRLLPASYCDFLINGINDNIKDRNITAVASELHLGQNTIGDIQHISSESMARDSGMLDKGDPDAAGFEIRLRLKKIDNLDTIQNGLVRYLEENEFAMTRKAAERKKLIALVNRLSERMQSLDSLKKSLNNRYANAGREQGIIFGEPADPVSVYKEEMNYYKEQLFLNEKLTNLDNTIEVFEPFVRQEVPNYPNLKPVLWISIAAGLLLALIITPLYGLRKDKKKRPLQEG